MRRMLIVDDEPLIADGLYAFFQKAQYEDLEILKVYSAAHAIEWLNIVKIDIVLSDICMPGMDGMQLIQEIGDRWPRCRIILLTGHNEFDYAHQAIRNPCVVDYLLKTEGMDKIRLAVDNLLQQIAQENDFHTQTQWFRSKLPRALPQLQKQLLLDVLRRSEGAEVKSLQDEFEAVHLPFEARSRVLPILIRIESWGTCETEYDRSLLRYAVTNIAEELLSDKAEVKAIELDRQTAACFVQPRKHHLHNLSEEETWERMHRFVNGTLESVQQACSECLHLSVSILAGTQAVAWPGLHRALNRLGLAAAGGHGMGMEKLVRVSLAEADASSGAGAGAAVRPGHNQLAVSMLQLEQLKQHLLQGHEDWTAAFGRWIGVTGEDGPQDPFLRLRLVNALGECLLQTLQELGLSAEETGIDVSPVLHFGIHTRWSDLLSFYQSAFHQVVSGRRDTYKHNEAHMLSAIHQYIKQHLRDDLSLTRIAQEVSLNPSYLSRWYKRVTGKGISDYILEKKVERSKELLLGTSYKMYDISEEVGFSDQHYFFRFFKKAVGCTPQEFRDQRRM